jgi:hypothetical protein
VFETLSDRLTQVFSSLRGRGRLAGRSAVAGRLRSCLKRRDEGCSCFAGRGGGSDGARLGGGAGGLPRAFLVGTGRLAMSKYAVSMAPPMEERSMASAIAICARRFPKPARKYDKRFNTPISRCPAARFALALGREAGFSCSTKFGPIFPARPLT